jgi:predicted  nucleic acid-binding Zn-ribbon protein
MVGNWRHAICTIEGMKNLKQSIPCLPMLLFCASAWALEASPAHLEITKQIDSAMDWAKHLRTEAGKARRMDSAHVHEEIRGIRDALKAIEETQTKIAQASPSEAAEGHFLAVKKHREKATSFIDQFETEHTRPAENFSSLKSLAKKTLNELEAAKHEHGLELSEIEQRH